MRRLGVMAISGAGPDPACRGTLSPWEVEYRGRQVKGYIFAVIYISG